MEALEEATPVVVVRPKLRPELRVMATLALVELATGSLTEGLPTTIGGCPVELTRGGKDDRERLLA